MSMIALLRFIAHEGILSGSLTTGNGVASFCGPPRVIIGYNVKISPKRSWKSPSDVWFVGGEKIFTLLALIGTVIEL